MLLKAAKIEHQGLHDPSFGLLERPGLDSGFCFQAPGMLLKAAKIVQQGYPKQKIPHMVFSASNNFEIVLPWPPGRP